MFRGWVQFCTGAIISPGIEEVPSPKIVIILHLTFKKNNHVGLAVSDILQYRYTNLYPVSFIFL